MFRDGAHLIALSAFAVAQPIFDILGQNPEFFVARGSGPTEIVVFALVVTFALPLALLSLEILVGSVSRPARLALHLTFVAALVTVAFLHAVTSRSWPDGTAALGLAAAGGAGFAALYWRARIARAFLTALVPVPFVVLPLFLFGSSVRELVDVETPVVQAATVRSKTPVVLIVFDEFNAASLMTPGERIDARRFPGFGLLARRSTWYRNASTVYWLSEGAVPAILTGNSPVPGRLPIYSEYPRSLFSLLGDGYRMRVFESLTRLCPAKLCRDAGRASSARVAEDSVARLASDVGVVYLHEVLPDPYAGRLPAIDEAWGNFASGGEAEQSPSRRTASGETLPCGRRVCEFVDAIKRDTGSPRAGLYFLHVALPHTPYVYLPSGKRYAVDLRVLRGRDDGGLWADAMAARQSNQRYLLQLGYTDRALALILSTLKRSGIYDRALVVVTADHGVSFRLGGKRRSPAPENLDDISFVPLFVKLPGQQRGRIDDAPARIVDVLPTIARALGVDVPWQIEGRPLGAARTSSGGIVSVMDPDGARVSASLTTLRAQRARALDAQAASFGTGSFDAVYRIGPHQGLVGRAVSSLRTRVADRETVQLDDAALLRAVDPSAEISPVFVEGTVRGTGPGAVDLAVAVNGRVSAVARSFRQREQVRFSAFVSERSLRAGRNEVTVYRVVRKPSGLALEELGQRAADLALRMRDGRPVVHSPDSRTIHVYPRVIRGDVTVKMSPTGARFSGRASMRVRGIRVGSIAVFVGNRSVYASSVGVLRPHRVLGERRLGPFGFSFELPRALLPEAGASQTVRVFAIRGRLASELSYARSYPWSTR